MIELIHDLVHTLEGKSYPVHKGLKQRGRGDLFENEVVELFSKNMADNFIYKKGEKSLEDFGISDKNRQITYLFDVKTHNIDPKKWSMSNLSALDKIIKLSNNYNELDELDEIPLYYIIIHYVITAGYVSIVKIDVVHLFKLPWENLNTANLGNGQLQITNMHKFQPLTIEDNTWVKTFKDKVIQFYISQITKFAKLLYNCLNSWNNSKQKGNQLFECSQMIETAQRLLNSLKE